MPGNRGEDFEKKNVIKFTFLTPKLSPLGVRGHEIYNFLSRYYTNAA